MPKRVLIAVVSFLALAVPGTAAAQPPALLGVTQQARHPAATFSAPGADSATIYFATRPDQASDGGFLQENIEDTDSLTADELQRGSLLYELQLDPGTYYVMMDADDWDCFDQPTCLDGYSNMLTLRVPKPSKTYRAGVTVLHYVHVAYLTLRVKPLGEPLPYKVCWRLASKKRRCVRSYVDGYSWNAPASDDVSVGLRGMARRTTFTWFVQGRKVASRTVNTASL